MDLRDLKALEIAARSKITFDGKVWTVPSQSGKGTYRVTIEAPVSCPCEDFATTGQPCKHVLAVRLVCERDHGGKHPPIVVKPTVSSSSSACGVSCSSVRSDFQK